MKADKEKIEWLLENETQYRISKETGVAQQTLSNLVIGKRKIENLTLKVSSQLTNYAEKLQKNR
ncbi:XRE family transcriptional regulator [Streptococcus suis]